MLLNGRRLAPYALSGGQSVDLSGIPASAIERVEVLKDGASAVYGTDAIGGVINFILRKDYQGVEVNANYFGTEHGGGNNGRVNVTAGLGDLAKDRYNLFISADYYKQDALERVAARQHEDGYLPGLGVDGTSPDFVPGQHRADGLDTATLRVQWYSQSHDSVSRRRDGRIPAPAVFVSDGEPSQYLCKFDFASTSRDDPRGREGQCRGPPDVAVRRRPSVLRRGLVLQRQVHPARLRRRRWPRSSRRRANDAAARVRPITRRRSSPDCPAAIRPCRSSSCTERSSWDPGSIRPTSTSGTRVVGLQGTVKGWDYQLAANYTANQQIDRYVSGWVYASKFGPLLRSGIVNPFGANTRQRCSR